MFHNASECPVCCTQVIAVCQHAVAKGLGGRGQGGAAGEGATGATQTAAGGLCSFFVGKDLMGKMVGGYVTISAVDAAAGQVGCKLTMGVCCAVLTALPQKRQQAREFDNTLPASVTLCPPCSWCHPPFCPTLPFVPFCPLSPPLFHCCPTCISHIFHHCLALPCDPPLFVLSCLCSPFLPPSRELSLCPFHPVTQLMVEADPSVLERVTIMEAIKQLQLSGKLQHFILLFWVG